jgi:type VI secretion system secreted protein VgrG
MSGSAADYAPVEVDFTPDPGFQLLFDGLHAEMELGRPFLFHVELSSGKLQSEVWKLIGSTCCVWLYQKENTEEKNRYFHGIVTRLVSAGLSGGAYRYKLEVRPWIWLLSQVTDCKIFQKKSAFKIVTDIFRDAGFSDFEDKRQSAAGDLELDYCVQYRETSLDFVTRLMEQFGFYYYFTFTKTAHTLVIVDDPNAHTPITPDMPYKFDQTEQRTVTEHIWQWNTDLGLLPGKWTYQDYNFTTPAADLTSKSMKAGEHSLHNSLEVYEYPGPYETVGDGHKLSDVRMQDIHARRRVFSGQSNSRKLLCGWRFTLKDYPSADSDMNRQYLIIHSMTTVEGAEGSPTDDAEGVDTYRVQVKCIAGDVPFRLARKTPRPVIRGPQTAKVVGASGDEVMTDQYGRIKVKFHWDRGEASDEDRSCWIRVAQSWAGSAWGSMTIPRVGMEVVVEFLEGNPDRPLITGVVYNANNTVPYALPANKTRTVFKSNSSTGGNGSNELYFEDKAGAEKIYMHAQFDHEYELTVSTGNHEMTVSTGNHSTTVSAGNHKLDVSAGKSEITAAQSITLTVGANSIKIDTSGITINGMKISAQASTTMSLQASASMTIDGGGMLSASAGLVKIN